MATKCVHIQEVDRVIGINAFPRQVLIRFHSNLQKLICNFSIFMIMPRPCVKRAKSYILKLAAIIPKSIFSLRLTDQTKPRRRNLMLQYLV